MRHPLYMGNVLPVLKPLIISPFFIFTIWFIFRVRLVDTLFHNATSLWEEVASNRETIGFVKYHDCCDAIGTVIGVSDCLASIWHQTLCKHHDNVNASAHIRFSPGNISKLHHDYVISHHITSRHGNNNAPCLLQQDYSIISQQLQWYSR